MKTGANLSDVSLARIEREFAMRQGVNQSEVRRRASDAPAPYVDAWANTAGWTGSGSVGSGRVFASANGLLRPVPTSSRWLMRSTFKAPGTAGRYSYMGILLADNSVLSIGQGGAAATVNVNRTGNIPAAAIVLPRALPALPAGDYITTIAKDETCLSFTIQSANNSGQMVYGTRILLSELPASIQSVFLSTNAVDANAHSWGSTVIYNELQVPPAASRGGLFTKTQPLVIWRKDTNGNGHYLSIPGDNDPRVPTPVVLFCHQSIASSGAGGVAPWAEARWANVLSAFTNAGYILVSSDNGPKTISGGTQDKYGNQAGLDDYASLLKWARQHFSTSATFLLGASMGGYFVHNLLHRREVGGIIAAATISGGYDLGAALRNASYRPLVLGAYGATNVSDFNAKVAQYDPSIQPGWEFRGVPIRLYSGKTDTLAPADIAVDPIVAKLGPYAPEVGVVSVSGAGHLADALYQGSDLVAFYDKYR